MDGTNSCYSRIVDTLQSAYPQVDIGIDRIFHKYDDIAMSLESIGNLLDSKRIGSGAGAYPQDVDARLESKSNVLLSCHLGSNHHPGFFLHAPEPLQSSGANSLKRPRHGARLPQSSTKDFYSYLVELASCGKSLFMGLGTARTSNDNRRLS